LLKKLRGLNPRVNYTDRATAACRRSLCQRLLIVPRGQRDESLRPYSRLSKPDPLLFLPSSSSIVLMRLSGPCSRTTTSQEILVAPVIEPGPLDLYPTNRSNDKRPKTCRWISRFSRVHFKVLVVQWLRQYTTSQKVAGSKPDEVNENFRFT
jgi:hypothetical protein